MSTLFRFRVWGLHARAPMKEGVRCTHVAMEATGVYARPVWHIPEDQFTLILANVEYRDLGGRYFEDRNKQQVTDRLLRRLRDLGVSVEVKAA